MVFSERPELRDAAKFLLGVIVVFALLYAASSLVPLIWVEHATAQIAVALLAPFGVSGSIDAGQEPVQIAIGGLNGTVQISALCTGVLELLVVWAAIIASFGIDWRRRAAGVAGAFALGTVFNQARIVVSVLAALSFDAGAAEIVHGVLFRVVLFLVVAGYYAGWFWWAAGRNARKAQKPLNKTNA